jgi:hypothetical protein
MTSSAEFDAGFELAILSSCARPRLDGLRSKFRFFVLPNTAYPVNPPTLFVFPPKLMKKGASSRVARFFLAHDTKTKKMYLMNSKCTKWS